MHMHSHHHEAGVEQISSGPEPEWTSERSWEVRYLEPGEVEFLEGAGGALHLAEADRCHVAVRVRRCFPQSAMGRYLSVSDSKDEEIGVIRDPRQLSRSDRKLVERALDMRYFIPRITRFCKAQEKAGMVYCVVDTDRGRREFAVTDPRANVQEVEDGRYVIQDVHGNRYEIVNVNDLDEKSQILATALA
jgi:hypothetical protein